MYQINLHIILYMQREYDKKKSDKYINLKNNGRLFPTWVMANFNKHVLSELNLDGDPCNDVKMGTEIRRYQSFVSNFLDYNSYFHDILLYHGVGSGKTRTSINIYNILYNYSPSWNVFILLKATLRDSVWIRELDKWLQTEDKDFRYANVNFISYDAPNADKLFFDKVKSSDSSKKSIYIIDEAHNFISNVFTNMVSKQGRRALSIYEHIMQDKKDNDRTYVIIISGTPVINDPYELAILFNLLRPGIFPNSYAEFNQLYVSTNIHSVINPATKNNFQRRIMGLVSHYIGATPDYYATKTIKYIDVPMSEYQELIYKHYEAIEEKIARKSKGSSGNYNAYTSQSCNFVFPMMSQGLSGETRPRPRDFKINESDVELFIKGKLDTEHDKQTQNHISEYLKKTELFAESFDTYIKNKFDNDIKNNYTIAEDIKKLQIPNIEEYINYMNDKKTKSTTLMAFHNCSAKMTFMVLQILYSPGPVLIYSNNVIMEGLQIFKIYLKYFGFTHFFNNTGVDNFRFMEYHGKVNKNDRRKILEIFNKPDNKLGAKCKIIMISPAGAEGISVNNIRQVHIMEPFWHEVRITQMIGRAIRMCSHKDLPLSDRKVVVFRYKSVRSSNLTKLTTDQQKEELAKTKDRLIQSFLDTLKEVAVDCVLNNSHNSLVSNTKCFQFEEQSLFDEHIGPAYRDDIYEDLKMNNGLNAENTIVKQIKVVKIKAVKQLVSDENSGNKTKTEIYSEPKDYWFNPQSLVIYDFEMKYPIGKVGTDDDGTPLRFDASTYIITHVIPIPFIKLKK